MENTQAKKSYLRFLNAIKAINDLPDFPDLDCIENHFLNLLGAEWLKNEPLTVVDAISLDNSISRSTMLRKLRSLEDKGVIHLETDPKDRRVKHVKSTKKTDAYFHQIGSCMTRALQHE